MNIAFEEVDVNAMCDILEKAGYHRTGKEMLISGINGEIIPAFIYFGPIYYQKLKHMVVDKIHARSKVVWFLRGSKNNFNPTTYGRKSQKRGSENGRDGKRLFGRVWSKVIFLNIKHAYK